MIDNTWAIDVETVVFATVKKRAQAILNSKYPNAFWTMDNVVNAEPTFPTIYMFMTSNEIGNDLEGEDINGISAMFQVEITVDKKQGIREGRLIAGVVMNEFKRLHFIVNQMPEFDGNTNDTKRLIFRCRRNIGQADILS